MVSGACVCCSRVELESVMREMPVRYKLAKMGNRMARYAERDVAELLVGQGSATDGVRMNLRRGRTKSNFCKWKGADKLDLGDQLHILKDIWVNWKDVKAYRKGSPEYVPFDLSRVEKWVKRTNALIGRKIQEREAGTLFP